MTKKKELLMALQSSMKLLVIVHEALRANGAHKSPLGDAIRQHASLCGSLLPNSMRLTQVEADQIRADSQLPPPAAGQTDGKIATPPRKGILTWA